LKSPSSRSHPSHVPLMSAVMRPDASSLSQYVEYQRIPMGPDLAPRRLNPFRASRFKSSFNPSCKQTRSRGGGIGYPRRWPPSSPLAIVRRGSVSGSNGKTPPRDRGGVFRGSAGGGLLSSTRTTTSNVLSSSSAAALLFSISSDRCQGWYWRWARWCREQASRSGWLELANRRCPARDRCVWRQRRRQLPVPITSPLI
jgi:hypothetical protein